MTNKTKGQPTNLTLAEALALLDYYAARARCHTEAAYVGACESAVNLIHETLDGLGANIIENGVTIHTGSDTPAPEGSPVVEVEQPEAEAPAAEQPTPAPKEPTFEDFLHELKAEAMARAPLHVFYPKYTVHDVERAALFRFGNLPEAACWMDTRHHMLICQTPRAVAAQGSESCEDLIHLLMDTVRQGAHS